MPRNLPKTEHERVWQRFVFKFGDPAKTTRDGRRRTANAKQGSQPFGKGRDPQGIGDVLEVAAANFGWTEDLARGDVIGNWASLVGEGAADHSVAQEVVNGELIVQCASTAWAQQLRMMHGDILQQLTTRFPDSGVQRIRFNGPHQRSFKAGYRSVPGRGPRDTYG